MDVPIALGIGGAFVASAWSTMRGEGAVYFDSIAMFIALVLAARWFELRVRESAGDAVEAIAREMPSVAERIDGYPGTSATTIVASTRLVERRRHPRERGCAVPADGVIVAGRSSVEEAVLTGESRPRARSPGDRVWRDRSTAKAR